MYIRLRHVNLFFCHVIDTVYILYDQIAVHLHEKDIRLINITCIYSCIESEVHVRVIT